ncbi:uncharacterized protein LOC131546059 [Onychostoma macrolepis]|uniref:uncharacterized protein LOC131546059 n=1 Tax=Onychostoma macrolepis TaxID=369639 RepID=UPI002729CF60|nr:uncharacterized protein LOC131546059 [Onychostoma macrolepis]
MTSETGKHAPHTSTKLPDTNKRSDVRKQWTRLEKLIWPVAPDGYIPNSVVRSLAPYPKFSTPCANRGLQIMAQIEDAKVRSAKQRRLLKYFLEKYCPLKEEQENKEEDEISLENVIESVPEETNIRASLTSLQNKSEETKTRASLTRRAVPRSQYLLQNRQKFLQQNASSVVKLQTNSSSADDLQMKDSSVDDLQTNAASVQELKSKEDGEKDQSLCENSNAFPSEQSKKVKRGQNTAFKLPEDVSTSLQKEQDELHQKVKEEQKKSDTTNKNAHVPEIGAPKRTIRHSPLKKLKCFVPPLPLGDRRPNSVLIYLYKRSKEESAHEGVKHAPKVA